jgi:hypothetical protein
LTGNGQKPKSCLRTSSQGINWRMRDNRGLRAFITAFVLWLGASSVVAAAPAQPAPALKIPLSKTAASFAAWVVASGDANGRPFLIVDKQNAQVLIFDAEGHLGDASPALLGLARGDDSVPGIGQRKLSSIKPSERTTPAGRFVAALGADLGEKDVLWVDYEDAISLHRVVPGTVKDRRAQRLASPSPLDKRISFGCINVPAQFFDMSVRPIFLSGKGIVYILPEVRSLKSVFPRYGEDSSVFP